MYSKKEYAECCRIITYKNTSPTILVDADSCPVKEEIVEIASRFSVKTLFIASDNHVKNNALAAPWVYVDTGKEAADLYIMNHAVQGDIVVTHIGLASMLLSKMAYALSPKGALFEEKDIETSLGIRYLEAKARKQGIYGKRPKRFTSADRAKFMSELTKNLSEFAGI